MPSKSTSGSWVERLGRLCSALAAPTDAAELEQAIGPARAAALGGDDVPPGASPDEEAFQAAVREVCSLALDRARLMRAAELDRGRAAAAEERAALLAEASVAMAESLDYPATLSRVAHLIVPRVADWCTIAVLDGEGRMRRVAVVHRDPQKQALCQAYLDGYGPEAHRPHMLDQLRGGHSVLREAVTDEELGQIAHDASHLELLRALGVSSALVVPLLVRGKHVGAISMMHSAPQRRFTAADVALGEDLVRRAAIAIDNARLYGDAQAALRAKDEFLALLGHELRNPLAPIVTALEIMGLRADPASEKERAIIARQVHHLVRLVDDLLDVSRITRGKVELKRAPTELARVVRKAVEMVTPLLEQRRHHLTLQVPSRGLVVDVDDMRIAQVIANLLSNAAKYTDPGGHISVLGAREGSSVLLRVRDDGAGIATELLPNIFDAFVQGQRGPDRALGGLGLGLTLVRSLVTLHGGSVAASSAGPGQGSEFLIRLPAAAAEAVPVAAARVDAPPPARHVLVVDDNADAAETLADFLRDLGYSVEVACDGPEALRLAARQRFAIAILDIGLPVMDGYELARSLRAALGADCPYLIALTGYGQDRDRARSAQVGFAVHLVKPVGPDQLLDAIARAPRLSAR